MFQFMLLELNIITELCGAQYARNILAKGMTAAAF